MELHDLKPAVGANKKRKRVGRGSGSGLGTTSGKGTKGQKARSGGGVRPGFEGGQMPLNRRLPKRGFNNARFATVYEIVNLDSIEAKYTDGEVVNLETLKEKNLVAGNKNGIKILAEGELTKKLKFEINKMSGSAQEKCEKAGCEVVILG
ncbi:ribosomal protein L15 [Denitrovibrio acetiphilus DSM 12809]|uniref:Large ribosomal subunit protein uL15 n=1 Tax=Denitrovibrio acetiphilus (strain DSM 12809 / NBRC 114555 / N2460) TaxID=522772 RepID=D4H3A6_DENA2|nr:50S ribosomal protein L15 [Denitrovibrio acetiphilus]ADD67190.1 ribosomal protein L15 [Denitrovibrio acetiphilus DSM 12809]